MRHLAGALVIASLLAGCGSSKSASTTTAAAAAKSSTQRAYEQKMAAIAPALQSKIFKLRFALEEAGSPFIARARLKNLDALLERRIAELKALKPPADVAAEHAKLIAGYRSLRADFDRTLKPLLRHRSSDAARVEAGKLGQAPAFQAIGKALHAIIAKGYDLGFAPGS